MQINVSRCLTFEYKPLFAKGIKLKSKQAESYYYYQCPVGYEIHNIGQDVIKDVVYPEYVLKDGYYIGTEKKKDLQPKEYMYLPTRYIILMLMQHGGDLEIENGRFDYISAEFTSKNSEELLSNFQFIPSTQLEDFLSLEDNRMIFYKRLGYIDYNDFYVNFKTKNTFNKFDHFIIDPNMLKLFGNYLNVLYNKPIKEIEDNNIKPSVLFLSEIIKRK